MCVFLFVSLCLSQGNMSVTVCHGGDPIPKSPFNIAVAPPLDLSKIKVQGLNNSEYELAGTSDSCFLLDPQGNEAAFIMWERPCQLKPFVFYVAIFPPGKQLSC